MLGREQILSGGGEHVSRVRVLPAELIVAVTSRKISVPPTNPEPPNITSKTPSEGCDKTPVTELNKDGVQGLGGKVGGPARQEKGTSVALPSSVSAVSPLRCA